MPPAPAPAAATCFAIAAYYLRVSPDVVWAWAEITCPPAFLKEGLRCHLQYPLVGPCRLPNHGWKPRATVAVALLAQPGPRCTQPHPWVAPARPLIRCFLCIGWHGVVALKTWGGAPAAVQLTLRRFLWPLLGEPSNPKYSRSLCALLGEPPNPHPKPHAFIGLHWAAPLHPQVTTLPLCPPSPNLVYTMPLVNYTNF